MARRGDSTAFLPVQVLIHYAWFASIQQHDDSALKYYATLVDQATSEDNAYWQARGLFGKAQSEIRLGDTVAARRSMSRFMAARAKVGRLTTDDQLVDVRLLEAELSLALQPKRTMDLVKQTLADSGFYRGERHNHQWAALILGARAALSAGDVAQARLFAQGASEVSTDSLQPGRWLGEAQLRLAEAEMAAGDTARARTLFAVATTALRNGGGESLPLFHAAQRTSAR
jgi:hypothetical protein